MSQEEHIMHQLKELHSWTVRAGSYMVVMTWLLGILVAITTATFLWVMFAK